MRISGVTINDNKRMEIALTDIFGIGRKQAKKILRDTGIDFGEKAKSLSQENENKIRKAIESMKIEGNLKREISGNIKRLKEIKSYRGTRHMKSLPTKGQRTKTNSRVVRGHTRKTMGSGKRKVEKK